MRQEKGGVGIGAALALVLVGSASAGEPTRHEFVEVHMGCRFTILLYSDDADSASTAAKAAFERVAVLDKILSDYDAESETNRLCAQAAAGPVAVSEDLFAVLARSLEVCEHSNKAFDPTIAPVIRLWRRARRERVLPNPAALEAARQLVGADAIEMDPEARTVTLTRPKMRLDFGGIAKGYAVEEAYRVLVAKGCPIALVAAEGDIRAGQAPPGHEGWSVAIAPPRAPQADPWPTLILADRAVSTSGDTSQYVEIDGKRYSHVVDPRTAQALTRQGTVTVAAADATTADAVATALCVLGPGESSRSLIDWARVEALFVTLRDGQMMTEATDGFAAIPRAAQPR